MGEPEKRGPLIGVRFGASRHLSWAPLLQVSTRKESVPPGSEAYQRERRRAHVQRSTFTLNARTSLFRACPTCIATEPADLSLDPDYMDD